MAERENPEFAGFARRIIKASGKRLASGDPSNLREFIDLQKTLKAAITDGVAGMRANGFTWEEIAKGAGIKVQTAHARWRHVDEIKHVDELKHVDEAKEAPCQSQETSSASGSSKS